MESLPEHQILKNVIVLCGTEFIEVLGLEYRKMMPLVMQYQKDVNEVVRLVNGVDMYQALSLLLLDISRLCSRSFFKEAVLLSAYIL